MRVCVVSGLAQYCTQVGGESRSHQFGRVAIEPLSHQFKISLNMQQVKKRGRPRTNFDGVNLAPDKIVKYAVVDNVDEAEDASVTEGSEMGDNTDNTTVACVESKQDVCFVCGEDKLLMYCDFPSCTKAYHYMCVMKTCCNDFQKYDINDNWYCPRHLCTGCNALQQTNASIHTLLIPKSVQDNCLSSNQNINNNAYYAAYDHIIQKPLKFCDNCPLSLCKDCELEYCNTDNTEVFSFSSVSLCRNCNCGSDTLLFARKLEAAWSFAVRNLVNCAIPFLRPLLPLTTSVSSDSSHSKSLDLLGILENIRKLKYKTMSVIENDFVAMRSEIIKIVGHESAILSAYDSVIKCMTDRISSSSSTLSNSSNRKFSSLNSIWRKECERALGRSVDSPELCIPARSIETWTEIISNKMNGDDCIWNNIDNPIQSILRAKGSNFNLNNSVISTNMSLLYADTEANRLHLGMEGKASRETVTLQEDCTDNDNMFKFKEYLANDEGIVVLDRLQSVCSHALHLGLRMEEEYNRSNIHIILNHDSDEGTSAANEGEVSSIPMLTVSELKLIKELKLSNDNLKWCIEQRKKVFDVNRDRIKILEEALQKSIRALETEENMLLEDKNKVSSCIQFDLLHHSNTHLHP